MLTRGDVFSEFLTPQFLSFAVAPLQHKNLVKLYGGCWTDGPDHLCIVLEYCPNGSLQDLLHTTCVDRKTEVTSAEAEENLWEVTFLGIIAGIVACFKYLHHDIGGEPLIHRDLKPANVLLAKQMQAKVAVSNRYI